MVLATGEVFTVLVDISDKEDPGIVVKENITLFLRQSEVRPAGRTRERLDAAAGITTPQELPPPPPENSLFLDRVQLYH